MTDAQARGSRVRLSLELFGDAVAMKRLSLHRAHPDLGPDDIEALVGAWLRDPGDLADGPGLRLRAG